MEVAVGPLRSPSWTKVLVELERRLFDLLLEPRAYLVLNTSRPEGFFVQFAVDHGLLTAETSAALRGGPDHTEWQLVDPGRASALVGLGWRRPVSDPLRLARPGDPSPNFHRKVEATVGWLPALFSDLTVHTFHDVWQVELGDITMRMSALETGETFCRC